MFADAVVKLCVAWVASLYLWRLVAPEFFVISPSMQSGLRDFLGRLVLTVALAYWVGAF